MKKPMFPMATIFVVVVLLASFRTTQAIADVPPTVHERMFEWTIQSTKHYPDPFNDVDVDVIFSKEGRSWRVPTFWRGGQKWTVRFSPPEPGTYAYHVESTDKSNRDLNGHDSRVTITAYSGNSPLLKHGMLKVSANKRNFEHSDGTPFYWLGDTWWAGLSGRLSWEGFQKLTADRKAKGFTVVQMVTGLVPEEEICPLDAGCQNEGGAVWDAEFKAINPRYFDYADRRVQHLVNSNIAPAIVGAWSPALDQMGVERIKKHWRYIIARYGAYPVFWIVGGEVFDPPEVVARKVPEMLKSKHPGAWTDVARYVGATDPYHHPLAAHEISTDDPPLQEDALTDFRLFQPGHFGWSGIGIEVAQLDLHFSRTAVTKPLVVGEIGYEMLGGTHLQDFQRTAFWLAMLNGAAGYTYGAIGTWQSYTPDKPFQRVKLSFLTWEEGMNLPGSYQIGLGAKLLQRHRWWKLEPHPDWVTPRGTTLLEPRGGINEFHIDLQGDWGYGRLGKLPESEWKRKEGEFRLPYAAGIPGEVRFVYLPYYGLVPPDPPTILRLEPGVRYRAYYWEPSIGIKVDLGAVERPLPGAPILKDGFSDRNVVWTDYGSLTTRSRGDLTATGQMLTVVNGVNESDLVVSVDIQSSANAGLVLRYRDVNNYISAVYSTDDRTIYLVECKDGVVGQPLGRTKVSFGAAVFHLTAEVRGSMGIVSLAAGDRTTTTPIVAVAHADTGGIGLMCNCSSATQHFENFEIDHSPVTPAAVTHLERRLYDAAGRYRGELSGPGVEGFVSWDDYGNDKHLLLDAYRPEVVPTPGDWILVLDASHSQPRGALHGWPCEPNCKE